MVVRQGLASSSRVGGGFASGSEIGELGSSFDTLYTDILRNGSYMLMLATEQDQEGQQRRTDLPLVTVLKAAEASKNTKSIHCDTKANFWNVIVLLYWLANVLRRCRINKIHSYLTGLGGLVNRTAVDSRGRASSISVSHGDGDGQTRSCVGLDRIAVYFPAVEACSGADIGKVGSGCCGVLDSIEM